MSRTLRALTGGHQECVEIGFRISTLRSENLGTDSSKADPRVFEVLLS